MTERFWELPLEQLDKEQWEALCDGCGRCCLKKLIDTKTELVHYTRVVCRYLEQNKCRCQAYSRRQKLVPDCLVLNMENLPQLHWIPYTCAYRLRLEGKPLPAWHPLLTGSRDAMRQEQISVTGKVVQKSMCTRTVFRNTSFAG